MMNTSGWKYILMSSSDNTRSKIRRANNPYKRYMDLRTADPNLGFVVGYYVSEKYTSLYPINKIENAIHTDIEDYRIYNSEDNKTEWFNITHEDAMIFVEEQLFLIIGKEVKAYYSNFDK